MSSSTWRGGSASLTELVPGGVVERIRTDLEAVLGRRVVDIAPVPEGRSGFTYRVQLEDGSRCFLRLPPPRARTAGPADVVRQARVMGALHAAGLPVPAVVAVSTSPAVDGRAFHLVEELPGVRVELLDLALRGPELATAATECLMRIQDVPMADTGLENETPTPLRTELARWTKLAQRSPTAHVATADRLAERLAAAAPPEREPVLVHGDYHYGNMLVDERGSPTAVLDWELASLGSPMLDPSTLRLAAIVTEQGRHTPPGGVPVHAAPETFLTAYADADGDEANWHLALAYLKYAAIYGSALALHLSGKRDLPAALDRRQTIIDYLKTGLELVA